MTERILSQAVYKRQRWDICEGTRQVLLATPTEKEAQKSAADQVTVKSSRFSVDFQGISRLGSAFVFLR